MQLLINSILFYKYMKREKYINSKYILLFLLLINVISLNFFSIDYHLALSILLIGAIVDIKTYKIPNYIVLSIFLLGLIKLKCNIEFNFIMSLVVIIFLFVLANFKNLIGMGDIKLFISLLIYLGGERFILLMLILSVLLFFFSIFIIVKRSDLKKIPLAPFITISYVLLGVLI